MKSLKKIMIAIVVLLSANAVQAQIKNVKTQKIKIYGNCGMCKKTIEKVANLENVVSVNWNKDSKIAVLTYDAKATNQEEILKRIAAAGYDSEKIKATDAAYQSLHTCCQYDLK